LHARLVSPVESAMFEAEQPTKSTDCVVMSEL